MARVKMLSMSSVTPLPLVPSVIITQSGPISTTSTFTNRQLHSGYNLLILLSEAQSWSSSIHTKQLAVVFLVWIMTRKLLVTEPKLMSIICLMQFRLAAMLSLQSELASFAYLMKEFMCFDVAPQPEQLSNLSRSFLEPIQRRFFGCSCVSRKPETAVARRTKVRHSLIIQQNYNRQSYQWNVLRNSMPNLLKMRMPSSSLMILFTFFRMSAMRLVSQFFQFLLLKTSSDLKSGKIFRNIFKRVSQLGFLQAVRLSSIFRISKLSLTTAVHIFHNSSSSAESYCLFAATISSMPIYSSGRYRS